MVPASLSAGNSIYDYDDYGSEVEAVEPCYCDHGCLEVGDCCPDFKDYCGGTGGILALLIVVQQRFSTFLERDPF